MALAAALALAAAATAAAGPSAPGVVSVRAGDLHLDGVALRRTPDLEASPDWSPDGRRIAFSRQRPTARGSSIWVVRRDGGGERRLTTGAAVDVMPAWSPDGTRIAFARSPVAGGSFDIWTVDARGGVPRRAAGGPQEQVAPRWTAAGRLAWTTLPPGEPWPDPQTDRGTPRSGPRELLPDFDQRAPFGLTVTGTRLGFASATDNVGEGPIRIRGARASVSAPMGATQLVELAGGGVRAYDVGMTIRYTPSPSHSHWHLLRFQAYELRRADDFAVVLRDRKSGFCLADHYGLAARRVAVFRPPRFLDDCAASRPEALAVEQGSSPGYTDLYPAHFHGQALELAGVPAGDYVLVHRANPDGRLEESDYANNAASIRLRLTWAGGVPRVETLRSCGATERC